MTSRFPELFEQSVSRETQTKVQRFAEMIVEENRVQNLVAAGSIPDLWNRHILDGAQIYRLAGGQGSWCDIGSGPGLPGIVIALMGGVPMTLIEPRRLRAEFLRSVVSELDIDGVVVEERKAEQVRGGFDIITARAVARLDRLFSIASHLAHDGTRWLLPKGESAKWELDEARRTWQGSFQLVPSQTHDKAAIVVAEGVRRRGKK